MDNETQVTVTDLLGFAHEQKPMDFENAFKSVMADKLVAAIDAKKLEIASSLYVSQEVETDEVEDDVEAETEEELETLETPEDQENGEES